MSGSHDVDWAAIDRAVGNRPGFAVHPGELVSDWMTANGVTQHELSVALGVTDPFVGMLRAGTKNVGLRTALKLEAATGVRAEVWLHLQMAYGLHGARSAVGS